LLRAATVVVLVCNEGVWHKAQPTSLKTCRPRVIDAAPPGTVADGAGGARNRMNSENFSMSLRSRLGSVIPVWPVMLFGTVSV